MGGVFDKMTHSAVVSPDGTVQWNASPQQGIKNLAKSEAKNVSPIPTDTNTGNFEPTQQPASQLVKPSFAQAATGPNGMPNAASPALTKGGKLAVLLMSGLQGALAGRAAQEQVSAQTGGRRSGGVGTGFQAGYQLPFMRAQMPLELQKQQAETGLAQAGLQPVQTPYGNMPAALASKILTPYLGYQGKVQAAQIGGQSREAAAQTGAQSRVQAAEIGKRFMAVPGVGLFDTQSKTLLPGSEQGITITPEIAADYELPSQFVGKPMNVQQLAQLERAQNQQETTVQGQSGPALVNKKTKQVTNLGLGNPGMGRPLQVGDVNNPGETTFTTGAQAVQSGAPGPQSASVEVPRKAAAAEVPTNIGNQKVAFNTAMQHADLLDSAAKALGNGDEQTLNSLKNKFKNEFGATGPITAQVIADAYGREVTKMLSANHMTDSEIASVGATVNPGRQSYDQIHSVLQGYKSLAQSKMNMLNQQSKSAVQGSQPKNRRTPAANDPLGIR